MLQRAEQILLFLTLFLLPTQLGKHFWPEFSFVYSLPIDYLSPTIYFWDILVLILCFVFIIQKKHINRKALNLFYFFILTQSLSLLVSQNPGSGFVRLEQYTLAGLLGVYIASLNLSGVRSIIFWGLGLSILTESTLAILQFINGSTLGLWILGERTFSLTTPGIAKFDFKGLEFLRPYGTFPHPNVLAGFMVITLPLISFLKHKDNGLLLRLSTVLGGMAAILTVSRTVLIAGFLEALVLLNRKWKMVLLIGVLILSPVIYTRFSALFNYDNLTFVRREELAGNAWKFFLSSPLVGVGLNNFIPLSAVGIVSGPSRFLQPVHNIFLLVLAETGIVGLTGLLITFGYPIWKGYSMIWGAIIFLGLFDHYFLTLPQGYRLLFLVWGISMSVVEFKGEKLS